jgi:hypothetical protein
MGWASIFSKKKQMVARSNTFFIVIAFVFLSLDMTLPVLFAILAFVLILIRRHYRDKE